jgi:hypothetical protein
VDTLGTSVYIAVLIRKHGESRRTGGSMIVAKLWILYMTAAREIDTFKFILLETSNTRFDTRNRFYAIGIP